MTRRAVLLLCLALAGTIAWTFRNEIFDRSSVPKLSAPSGRADHVLIEASTGRLTASQDGKPVFYADVVLGPRWNTEGENGEWLTPEGILVINRRARDEAFHLVLGLKYPRDEDIRVSQETGLDPGPPIFLHGQSPESGTISIGLSNPDIETLWSIAAIGTRVEIRP